MPETQNIYQKLAEARRIIRTTLQDVSDEGKKTKAGENEYSKYSYFKPEDVERWVTEACEQTGLITLTSLLHDEHGLYQQLQLLDVKSPQEILTFTLRTEKGSLKAANETQNMGATQPYSKRYLLMATFNIAEPNLDPDKHMGEVKKS